ncbi:FkbM family methyltransferase [Pontibacter qinzhouensis]|uniref:FkbM family methyltransferase n=1 Tax=Pontibacter qinzhouensis TaxID=2603253 RepID=A0A5C8K9Q4_9BACT|nr:FkbM family methyltransferase [Pontibacter qinzhouensis]TXK50810.1 FkbM family methyltransferase [Pontibacter qinzhouensis]
MTEIFNKLKSKNLTFQHVCEVGVYLPEVSNVIDFIRSGVRTSLVEADLGIVEKIKQVFKDYNITVYPFAVWDYTGTVNFSKAHASSFVTQLKGSPALINDKFVVTEDNTQEVTCKVFSEIDDGTIDLLSIDIEGSEWYVIKHMVSRPKVISIETHGKKYVNPFIQEILAWMEKNNYQIWYKDVSDTVFVKKGTFEITALEKLQLKLINLRVNLRRARKNLMG